MPKSAKTYKSVIDFNSQNLKNNRKMRNSLPESSTTLIYKMIEVSQMWTKEKYRGELESGRVHSQQL